MNKVLLYIALLPTLVLGGYIYNNDRMGKEPKGLLFKCFIAGIGSVIITLVLSGLLDVIYFTDNLLNYGIIGAFIYCVFSIALIEEFSKYIMLKLSTWNHKEFDHIFDAIVYAVFVSLGFATIENLLYVFGNENGLWVAIFRAILSVPGHAFFGIYMGYYYGLAKQSEINNNIKLKNKNLSLTLIIPILMHGFYDFCIYANNFIFVVIYFIFVIILYIKAFKTVSKVARVQKNMKN